MRIRGITGKDTGSRQGEMGHVAEQRGLKARVREEVWFQALVAAVASLTKLADFDQWDVIVQYDSDGGNVVEWLSYNPGETLMGGEWDKDIGDVFEPGIFNPREVMTITLVVASSIGQPSTNLATIATPNGISASAVFTR